VRKIKPYNSKCSFLGFKKSAEILKKSIILWECNESPFPVDRLTPNPSPKGEGPRLLSEQYIVPYTPFGAKE
jgi:hypothetical protein